MDLFSAGKTPEQQIKDLKGEIKGFAKSNNLDYIKKNTKLLYGNLKDIGNNILIVTNISTAKYFESIDDKNICKLLAEFGIQKFFIVYNYCLRREGLTKKEVKEASYYVKKLTEILEPKLIVCLGELSQFVFFKKKFIIRDYHGKKIGDFNSIPIFTAYEILYYSERSKFEDALYKDHIKNSDWAAIKETYLKVIK